MFEDIFFFFFLVCNVSVYMYFTRDFDFSSIA